MITLSQIVSRSLRVFLLIALLSGPLASANEPEAVLSAESPSTTRTDQPRKEGPWLIDRDEQTGIRIHTMEMTLHPKAEPRPALKHRLIPDDFDMLDGNAALYYLKAGGFFEQEPARERLREVFKQAVKTAQEEDKQLSEVPPFSWQAMEPSDLPLEEVKEHLKLTAFQPFFLEEAAKRRRFDLDRNIRTLDSPYAYLLPEFQSFRAIARTQELRCKVAIAEDRIDDAIAIIGQQYAWASHLGQDDFFVSALVGVAIAGITWTDALTLAQHPDTPNLYWAYASLPHPLVNTSHSSSVERQFLYMQVKALREVNETPRTVGYWKNFVDRVAVQIGGLASELGMTSKDPERNRALLVGYIAAAYPGAKRYLMEKYDFSQETIEAYPTAQVVFLAVVRHYENARDNYFKWSKLPYWQARSKLESGRRSVELASEAKQVGWAAAPANVFLPAFLVVQTASARNEQMIALLQTVEAVRMYGAEHDGKLPPTLDDLSVPAPMEPFTGQPLDYEYHQSFAVLNGHKMPGLKYRLILRFANQE
jgi:hypothetical protein